MPEEQPEWKLYVDVVYIITHDLLIFVISVLYSMVRDVFYSPASPWINLFIDCVVPF